MNRFAADLERGTARGRERHRLARRSGAATTTSCTGSRSRTRPLLAHRAIGPRPSRATGTSCATTRAASSGRRGSRTRGSPSPRRASRRWAREQRGGRAPVRGRRSASWTWSGLSREVTRLAEALASLGIGAGDAVRIFLPMAPEAAIAARLRPPRRRSGADLLRLRRPGDRLAARGRRRPGARHRRRLSPARRRAADEGDRGRSARGRAVRRARRRPAGSGSTCR